MQFTPARIQALHVRTAEHPPAATDDEVAVVPLTDDRAAQIEATLAAARSAVWHGADSVGLDYRADGDAEEYLEHLADTLAARALRDGDPMPALTGGELARLKRIAEERASA